MLELLATVAVALGLASFCSMSEAVLNSLHWSWLEQMRTEGKRSGEILYQMRLDMGKPLTAILVLNTIACSVGAVFSGLLAADVLGPDKRIAFTAFFAVVIVVFGEILPRALGRAHALTLAPLLARPLRVLLAAFTPVLFLCGLITRLTWSQPTSPGQDSGATEEDIRAMVRLTSRAGQLKPLEESSIVNILALDTKIVSQSMTPRTVMTSLPEEFTVVEARAANPQWPHSRVPVYEGDDPDNVVGVVRRRQVLEAMASGQTGVTLGQLMKPAQFVLESLPLDKALLKFLEQRMHLFVVLDEYGGVCGVITLEDILEEILGKEIVDETDQVADMRELARTRREALLHELSSAREK